MFTSAIAGARFSMSMTLGRSFHRRSLDRLLEGMRSVQNEFGDLGGGGGLFDGMVLDEQTRRVAQGRRLRTQAMRAAAQTTFYADVFSRIGVDPAGLRYESISSIPVTSKQALRDNPDAFVRRDGNPMHRCGTTGTTGRVTQLWFSDDEIHFIGALSALGQFQSKAFQSDDHVMISISTRNQLAVHATTASAVAIGAAVHLAGMVSPEQTLKALAERHQLPGRKSRISVMTTYPSYFGQLIETAASLGYRPTDFGVERVLLGGEVASTGLRRRARRVFGEVDIVETFGMTELVPFGASRCERGHFHYEPATCLVEVLDLEGTQRQVTAGMPGILVGTPLPPFRDTTLLLRYNTEDVVRTLTGEPGCTMHRLPAMSELLGKWRLAARHDGGWTFQRDVVEALEAVEAVPLPARFGFWTWAGGVAVEVVVRSVDAASRASVEAALDQFGIPLTQLRLVESPDHLCRPVPLRCDLRETVLTPANEVVTRPSSPTAPLMGAASEVGVRP